MLAPHCVHSLASCGQRLRDTPWTAALRYAWATLLACVAIKWLLPAAWVHTLQPLLKVAPLFPFVAKDLSHLPDALARTRAALASRDWRALLLAWLAPELVGLLRLDSALRRGFIGWLLRRPQPSLPPGQAFSYLERGSYSTVVAMTLFCTLVELPLDGLIVPLFIKSAHTRHLIHLVMLCACLSTLVWVLGDRWLVGKGRHVLDDACLHVRVGARTTGSLPRDAILRCEPLTVTMEAWCRSTASRRTAPCALPLSTSRMPS